MSVIKVSLPDELTDEAMRLYLRRNPDTAPADLRRRTVATALAEYVLHERRSAERAKERRRRQAVERAALVARVAELEATKQERRDILSGSQMDVGQVLADMDTV